MKTKKKIRKWVAFVVLCAVLLGNDCFAGVKVKAESAKCGENLTYKIVVDDEGDAILKIEGTGEMYDYDDVAAPWKDEEFYYVVISEGVTSIGSRAFEGCSALTDVTIPDSVTAIGLYAFLDCSGLIEIVLPKSITSIGEGCFLGCTGLQNINIPASVTIINAGVFYGCTSLSGVVIPSEVKYLGTLAFYRCESLCSIELPDKITSIGSQAFGCTALEKISLPDSIKKIGGYAFGDCKNLESVELPNDIISIDDSTFSRCTALKKISLPDSIKEIGYGAFSGCTNLENVELPDDLISIDDNAFKDCENLSEINIPKSITSFGGGAFTNTQWLKNRQEENALVIVNDILIDGTACSINNVKIANSVKVIAESAFFGCEQLETITLPDNLTDINNGAFEECINLKQITIPEDVESIGPCAFNGCTSLANIEFTPTHLSYVGIGAFKKTPWLDNVEPTNGMIIGNGILIDGEACTGKVEIPEDVVCIASDAFGDLIKDVGSEVEEVVIPSSVRGIGDAAFWRCYDLKKVTISEGVKTIGSYAFYGTGGATGTAITVPESVTEISGDSAFDSDCILYLKKGSCIEEYALLHDIDYSYEEIPEDLSEVKRDERIYETVDWGIKQEILTISGEGRMGNGYNIDTPDWIRYYGSVIKKIEIKENITVLSDYSFTRCSSVIESILPDSLLRINSNAFSDCISLTQIVIPQNVQVIGPRAFNSCFELKRVLILSKDVLIADNAFSGDDNVFIVGYSGSTAETYAKEHNIRFVVYGSAEDNDDWMKEDIVDDSEDNGNEENSNEIKNEDGNSNENPGEQNAEGTNVANGSTSEGNGVEEQKEESTKASNKVTIDNVQYKTNQNGRAIIQSVPANIKKLVIPSKIKNNGESYKVSQIGNNAFINCKKLKTVTIGKNVESIGKNAFKNCVNLKKITIKSTKLNKIGKNAFAGVPKDCVIVVPKKCVKQYKKLLKGKNAFKLVVSE